MVYPNDSQQFLASYDSNPARSRQPSGLLGSIWAPQPQPIDHSWPRTLDTFSRAVDREPENSMRLEARNTPNTAQPVVTREDIFGHNGPQATQKSLREVGAIGDGRKKNQAEYDDNHVEQLLRTLNLNSPAPFTHKPSPLALNMDNTPNSPDFSPASVSSALLTPTDLSPNGVKSFDLKVHLPYDYHNNPFTTDSNAIFENAHQGNMIQLNRGAHKYPTSFFEPFAEPQTPAPGTPNPLTSHVPSVADLPRSLYSSPLPRRNDNMRSVTMDWRLAHQLQQQPNQPNQNEWRIATEKVTLEHQVQHHHQAPEQLSPQHAHHEPINFLSLLHPSSSPPYHVFVARIIKSSDQQASIFLQQKLKVADMEERAKIVDAICARGFEMMAHRFGNWAVQRCLEAASTVEERRKIVSCMRGRIVDLATNCYGCHVLQKALDCEEDIRLLIVSELLLGDPAQTLVNKHASHVWSKIMELSWTPPAPPIFTYVNKSLKGKWAALACHETGSLVVQHAFENLEAEAKDGIVDELLNQGFAIFSEVTKSQWGSYCIQHILEHGSDKHKRMTLDHLLDGLLEFSTNEQGAKSVTKALREGGAETLDKIVRRMCEPARGARRAMIVDLALSVTGSQLIASVLPTADKDQRALLYECIRGHIVTLRGCKTGSKVIWLL
ncbi:armadillo-type protein [Panaeolus papilionaceus]|nr:armadillo-type protein [Panaeolus papilionaceus]